MDILDDIRVSKLSAKVFKSELIWTDLASSLCFPLQFWSSSATRSLFLASLTALATGPWRLRSGTAHQVLEIAQAVSNSLAQRMAASWAYLNGINATAPAALSLGVDKDKALDWWESPAVSQSSGRPAHLSCVEGDIGGWEDAAVIIGTRYRPWERAE